VVETLTGFLSDFQQRSYPVSVIQEFKEFAIKGNLIDMAVGIVIGGAFGKIVSSLVADLIMPVVGLIAGGVNFGDLFINLSSTHYASLAEATAASAPVLKYGMFLQTVFDFLIVATAIFVVIKAINKLKREKAAEPVAPADTPEEIQLLRQIRDSLRKTP
jgi:large conductance mechanosensitive channel